VGPEQVSTPRNHNNGVFRGVARPASDPMVSKQLDIAAVRRFLTRAIAAHGKPGVVVADRALSFANVIADLVAGALHNTDKDAKNRMRPRATQGEVETDARVEERPHRSRVDFGLRSSRTCGAALRSRSRVAPSAPPLCCRVRRNRHLDLIGAHRSGVPHARDQIRQRCSRFRQRHRGLCHSVSGPAYENPSTLRAVFDLTVVPLPN